MILLRSNPTIEWFNDQGKECLKLSFHKNLTNEDSIVAIDIWCKIFSARHNHKLVVIWDSSRIHGMDLQLIKKWNQIIHAFEKQIEHVWVVSPQGDHPFPNFHSPFFLLEVIHSSKDIRLD